MAKAPKLQPKFRWGNAYRVVKLTFGSGRTRWAVQEHVAHDIELHNKFGVDPEPEEWYTIHTGGKVKQTSYLTLEGACEAADRFYNDYVVKEVVVVV